MIAIGIIGLILLAAATTGIWFIYMAIDKILGKDIETRLDEWHEEWRAGTRR